MQTEVLFKIRYRKSRAQAWDEYWYAWRKEPWARFRLIGTPAAIGSLLGLLPYFFYGDVYVAIGSALFGAAVVPIAVPFVWSRIAETMEHHLVLHGDGISERIGETTTNKPWHSIRDVVEDESFVVVNAVGDDLTIPIAAFDSPHQHAQFVEIIQSHITSGKA
nr:hypothetical protein [uncultured bacterium]